METFPLELQARIEPRIGVAQMKWVNAWF